MRIPLTNGDYKARSIIASAQRCVNMYAEANPKDSPTPFTYYPAPGLRQLAMPSTAGPARCLYRSNLDQLYYVAGGAVFYISPGFVLTQIGSIDATGAGESPLKPSMCSMMDNGTTAILVDGTVNTTGLSTNNGWTINLTTHAFAPINITNNSPPSPNVFAFYGATRVDNQDGYFILNEPTTRNFYTSYLNTTEFDSLYFAAKNAFSDTLVAAVVQRREIWLIGQKTTEIWYNAGNTGFPFAIMAGPFIQHGCVAPYSIACADGAIYWLSQDQNGKNVLARGIGYRATPVSTRALETEWSSYTRTDDAIGFCFQQNGHTFYQINFPTADKSYRFDETTEQWHEAVWIDGNGAEHRHRGQCSAFAYGTNVVGDWQTGALYALDPTVYTDVAQPMVFRRGFPHIIANGERMVYPAFILDMDCGETSTSGAIDRPMQDQTGADMTDQTGSPMLAAPSLSVLEPYPSPTLALPLRAPDGTSLGLIGTPATDGSQQIYLRWSDDRGRTWSNPVPQSIGGTGQYNHQPKWNRTGMARDRVFETFGVIPGPMAINGGWLDRGPVPSKS